MSADLDAALALLDAGLGVTDSARVLHRARASLNTHHETISLAAARVLEADALMHETIAAELRDASEQVRGTR